MTTIWQPFYSRSQVKVKGAGTLCVRSFPTTENTKYHAETGYEILPDVAVAVKLQINSS